MVLARPRESDWILAAAYFATAALALATTRFDGGIAFLWSATALLVPVLAQRRRRAWPTPLLLCGAASALATGLFGLGWDAALPLAAANLLEAAIGARLLMERRSAASPFGSLGWLVRFIVSVGIVAPLVACVPAGLVAAMAGHPPLSSAVHFYLGHALGAITFIPIASLVISGQLATEIRAMKRGRALETVALLALVGVVTVIAFADTSRPLLFLPCGPIVFAIFRGRQIGAAGSIVLLALIGGGFTLSGHGPIQLIDAPFGERILFFQFYLACVVLAALPIAADLRHRAKLHRALRLSEERYRMMADHSSDILMHLETDGRIRFVSPAIERIGGYDPAALIGHLPTAMIAPEDRALVGDEHRAALAGRGDTRTFDYRGLTAAGEQRWFETHTRAIVDRAGEVDGVLSVIRDISERKAVEVALTEAALTDPLTGLPNRRAFHDRVEAQAASSGRDRVSCVALLDIDHFKRVNDTHGHDGGDAVLVQFAAVASHFLRGSDFVARFGGEEFALFLPDTTLEAALTTCDRLRREIAEMGVPTRTGMIRVTVSGGVAAIGPHGLQAALKRADQALYEAKEGGRDQLMLAA